MLTQKKALELSAYDDLIILCGHYEGIDQRAVDYVCDEEISIGDYVLTGGEIPACILIDAVARTCKGVLSDDSCFEEESIASGLLEYPQYTRPFEFHGVTVPDVLISGHHENIEKWRNESCICLKKYVGWGEVGWRNCCQCRRHKRHGFEPWVGNIPWSRKSQLPSVYLPGKSH